MISVQTIRANVIHNDLPLDKVIPHQGDAKYVCAIAHVAHRPGHDQ